MSTATGMTIWRGAGTKTQILTTKPVSTYQLIAVPPDIQDADIWVFAELFAQLGDENIHAPGIEKIVIAP